MPSPIHLDMPSPNGADMPCLHVYRPWLRSVIASRMPPAIRSRMDESDIVQETLLQACKDAGCFRGRTDGELRAWLLRMLEHQLVDAVRFHRRQRRNPAREQSDDPENVVADIPTPSAVMHTREVHEKFWKAMSELPEHYQTVILLRQQQDLTFEQIGQIMDRPADNVRMLWGRAVLALGGSLRRMGLD